MEDSVYCVKYMVKGNGDNERGNLLPPLFVLFFFINSKGSFILLSEWSFTMSDTI